MSNWTGYQTTRRQMATIIMPDGARATIQHKSNRKKKGGRYLIELPYTGEILRFRTAPAAKAWMRVVGAKFHRDHFNFFNRCPQELTTPEDVTWSGK